MKKLLIIALYLFFIGCQNTSPNNSNSQEGGVQDFYLKAEDVAKHVGYDVEIKVKIETSYYKEKENPYPTYLDVSKNFEENPFAIIIPNAVRNKFPPHQTYRGKTVIIRGRVDTYDPWPYDDIVEKKACIYLRTPDQISIVSK
jgi:hypothetical protein